MELTTDMDKSSTPGKIDPSSSMQILAEIKAWIADLPLANIARVTDMLYSYLGHLDLTSLKVESALMILEFFEPTMTYLRGGWQKQHYTTHLSVPDQRNKFSVTIQDLESRYATLYVSLLDNLKQEPEGKAKDLLQAKVLHHAIMHLLNILFTAYSRYQEPPLQLWMKLHKLYLHAQKNQLENISLVGANAPISSFSSIANAYKHSLLLATVFPFRLRIKELEKVQQALLSWSSLTKLSKDKNLEALFTIHLESDFPPHYQVLDKTPTTALTLYFDTQGLTTHLKSISEGQHNPELAQRIVSYVSKNLLDYLIHVWEVPYQRRYNRTPKNTPLTVCIGLSACCYFISGVSTDEALVSRPVADGALELMPVEDENERLAEALRGKKLTDTSKEVHTFIKHKAYTWNTQNSDPEGYCLTTTGEKPALIQAGELIGLRDMTDDTEQASWSIGVVRWLKRSEGQLQVGVQLLSPSAIAVKVKIKRTTPSDFLNALLLPDLISAGHPTTMLLPPLDYKVNETFQVSNPTFDFSATFGKIISTSESYTQIEYTPLNPTTAQSESEDQTTDDAVWKTIV